jgi:hypothetical protein
MRTTIEELMLASSDPVATNSFTLPPHVCNCTSFAPSSKARLASTANDFTWHATLAFSSNIGFVVTPVTLSPCHTTPF